MSKKNILICISVIVILLAGVAIAVSSLYSGVGADGKDSLDDSRYDLFHAVPSDAVAVLGFSDLEEMVGMLSRERHPLAPFVMSGPEAFPDFLSMLSSSDRMPGAKSRTALSLHYNGAFMPLLVIDAGKSGEEMPENASALMAMAADAGLYADYVDCSAIVSRDSGLYRRGIVLVSTSDMTVKSARRHLSRNISVADSDGFAEAASAVDGQTLLFVSAGGMDKIFQSVFSGKYRKYSGFFSDVADWVAFSVYSADGFHVYLKGVPSFLDGVEDFMTVFSSLPASDCRVSRMLPSYALFAASVPMGDCSAYIDAHDRFVDTRSSAARLESKRRALGKAAGMAPEDWASRLSIQEAAVVSFYAGSAVEQAVLLRAGAKDALSMLLDGEDAVNMKNYRPQIHPYAYSGFAASLFGTLFSIKDESFFTYIDGWIISGSEAAVNEYVSGRALENTLMEYMSDAGLPDRMSGKEMSFASYFSVTESADAAGAIFSKDFAASLSASAEGITYEPVTLSVSMVKSMPEISVEIDRVSVRKSKPPVFERDTLVEVSKGPFRVKNSGTGRMNLFYQQDNLYLCLQEESGKGIWGAPFSAPICGRAGTVDYFANGKLQILFASGSKLYLIDRLGRFVSPFPVDLGKEILLGPDIYDFNGARRYNVMVLHTDNTIDMYNLQGRKPQQWKGITARETIKGLPEPVKVGGKTFWVVRTSLQTLIFPFYGGEPLTAGTGDRMIRTDSKIVPGQGNTVTAVCYDGKEHQFKL